MSAIFNWCVEGLQRYRISRNGIKGNIPAGALEQIDEYEKSSDIFGQFLGDCVMKVHGAVTRLDSLYTAYTTWAEDNGYHPMSSKTFSSTMKERGHFSHRDKKGIVFESISLIDDREEQK